MDFVIRGHAAIRDNGALAQKAGRLQEQRKVVLDDNVSRVLSVVAGQHDQHALGVGAMELEYRHSD